jgi:hypothetical protein
MVTSQANEEVNRKHNWYFVFQQGYQLVGLPLNLFVFATTIYYLMVNSIPWLKNIFPEFWIFLVVGGIIGVPTMWVIGAFYIRSELFKGSTKVNPYSYILLKNQIPLYEAIALEVEEKGERGKVLAEQLREMVRQS